PHQRAARPVAPRLAPTRAASDLYRPPEPVCDWKVCGLSPSLIVSVPLLLMSTAELVSVRFRVSDDSTAGSLVPRMLMVTVVEVASALRTVDVSLLVVPATNSLFA